MLICVLVIYEVDMVLIFVYKLRNFEFFETFGFKKSVFLSVVFVIFFVVFMLFIDDEL